MRWLRAQERDGAFEKRPCRAQALLEAFQFELLEQFRWEESVQFTLICSRLEGHYKPRVDALLAEHAELSRRLVEILDTVRVGSVEGMLSLVFGAQLRCFLDTLEQHCGREELLSAEIRLATGLSEWPDARHRAPGS